MGSSSTPADPRTVAQRTAAVVAETEQTFAEALERLEDQLDQLANWAAEHGHAEHADLIFDAAGSVRAARTLGS
jgi:hypothetical protein